jgi:hypothetical protein
LTNRGEKIGILAKGCDSRNIVTHIIKGCLISVKFPPCLREKSVKSSKMKITSP